MLSLAETPLETPPWWVGFWNAYLTIHLQILSSRLFSLAISSVFSSLSLNALSTASFKSLVRSASLTSHSVESLSVNSILLGNLGIKIESTLPSTNANKEVITIVKNENLLLIIWFLLFSTFPKILVNIKMSKQIVPPFRFFHFFLVWTPYRQTSRLI